MSIKVLTTHHVKAKRFDYIPFDGEWKRIFGEQSTRCGLWHIYGNEKNGKTTFSILLAHSLSLHYRVLFISGEQGIDDAFAHSVGRFGLDWKGRKMGWSDYATIPEIQERLDKPRSESVIFIDNLTVYEEEFKNKRFWTELVKRYPEKLFIMIGHSNGEEPHGATGRAVRKLSKMVIHIKGMQAEVLDRKEKGCSFLIDEEKAMICGVF